MIKVRICIAYQISPIWQVLGGCLGLLASLQCTHSTGNPELNSRKYPYQEWLSKINKSKISCYLSNFSVLKYLSKILFSIDLKSGNRGTNPYLSLLLCFRQIFHEALVSHSSWKGLHFKYRIILWSLWKHVLT